MIMTTATPPVSENIVQGFRRSLTDAIVDNLPKGDSKATQGYLLLLYVLRANTLPSAYVRSKEVTTLQEQISTAISRIERFGTEIAD
jgi:hypothetical protein